MAAAAATDGAAGAAEQHATLLSPQERDDAADLERGAADSTVTLQVRSLAGGVVCELRVARETPFAELKLFIARASGMHRAALQLALGPALLEDPTERPLLALGDEASEATMQLVRREGDTFRVNSCNMKSKRRGLKYHDAPITLPISARKATSSLRCAAQVAKWGSSVFGVALEAPHVGWVQVGEKYLPIKVAGKTVLLPHKRAEQDERERSMKVAQDALRHLRWMMPCWCFLLVAIYPLAVLSIRYETSPPNRLLWWFCWSFLPLSGYYLMRKFGKLLPNLISPLKSPTSTNARMIRLHRLVARVFYGYTTVFLGLLLLGLYFLSIASFDDFALRMGRELAVGAGPNDTGLAARLGDNVALVTFPANSTHIPTGVGAVFSHEYDSPFGCDGQRCRGIMRTAMRRRLPRVFLAAPIYRRDDVARGGELGSHPIAVVFQVRNDFGGGAASLRWEACRAGRICGFLLENDVVAAKWAQWAPEMTLAGILSSIRPRDHRRHARELVDEVIAALHLSKEKNRLQGLPVLWLPPSTRHAVDDWDRRRALSALARPPGVKCTSLALVLAALQLATLLALVRRSGPKLRALAAGASGRDLRASANNGTPVAGAGEE